MITMANTALIDGIDLLTHQHHELDLAVCRVRAARTMPDRAAACRDLAHELTVHLALEDRLLDPQLAARGLGDQATAAAMERIAVRRALAQVMETDPADAPFAERLAALAKALNAHARTDERGLFEAARAALDPQSLVTLAHGIMSMLSQMDERKNASAGADVGIGGAAAVALG